jgi:hypothetical protein
MRVQLLPRCHGGLRKSAPGTELAAVDQLPQPVKKLAE